MKKNIDIEDLFREKFENFQPQVDPSVWAGIQSSLGTSTAATATGLSTVAKIGLISSGIVAASVATWYFGFYEPQKQTPAAENVVTLTNTQPETTTGETIIYVEDQNDPVILENKEKIETELRNNPVQPIENSGTISNGSTQGGNEVIIVTPINPVNGGNSTNGGNSSVENGGNPIAEQGGTQGTNPDGKKDPLPTGRMEINQANLYAPSAVTFVSNARYQKEVKWDFGDGHTSVGADAKHTYTKPGKYLVKMTVVGEKSNYEETQEIVVKSKSSIDNVPNVITPNGDRINDYFFVKTTDIETFFITITDRNGNEIFSSNDKDFSWDGTNLGGELVAKGLYTYLIMAEGKDGSVIKLPGMIYVE